jgi:hypothetical protein
MTTSKWLSMSLLLAALAISPSAQAAANLNDYLTHGYRIASRTQVVGIFSGCERDRWIQFGDKSVFSCDTHFSHNAYAPSVFILQTKDVPPQYAVLIDGKPYVGSLVRIFGKKPRNPIPVVATIASPSLATTIITARPLTAATPLTPQGLEQPAYPGPNEQ